MDLYKNGLIKQKLKQNLQLSSSSSCLPLVEGYQKKKKSLEILFNDLHKSFVCTQFKCQTVLFNPLIGPYNLLLLLVWVDLGAMEMKRYSAFPKALALLEPAIT